jgi:hypothetical protein
MHVDMAYTKAMFKQARKRVRHVRGNGKRTKSSIPKKRKLAIKKIVRSEIDKDTPDTHITTYRRTEYNSGIGTGDVGYIWKDVTEPNIGGLAVVRRLAAIEALPESIGAAGVVGNGLKIRSLYYHGSFHISPFVFADDAGIQNNQVRVHCWVLSDKYNPIGGTTSDRNCVNDLLNQPSQIFPNATGSYLPSQIQNSMIPFSGTILDEDLKVNTRRIKVHAHKVWNIIPTSAVFDVVDTIPNISTSGNFHRRFRIKIPTPKIAKWDRRDLDLPCGNADVQTPIIVHDPFVVWGYTVYPQEEGPDVLAANLVVENYLTLRCEPHIASAA